MVARAENLIVALNGLTVGTLSKFKNGGIQFQYHESWLATPQARPISLSMPLQRKAYEGEIVFNFFDNLLPDNESIRSRIQTRFKISTKHPFDLLSSIGRDCVGAIQLYPEECDIPPVKQIHSQPLTEKAISKLLHNYRSIPLGMDDSTEDFRISIAGAQEKTALLWHQNKWCKPHGSTPTSHIIKLPIGQIEHSQLDLSESCENEWVCLQIAKCYGLAVAKAEVIHFDGIKTLVIERFDRRWSKDGSWLMRLPQEDMCQALGIAGTLKYQSDGGPGIADVMKLLIGSQQALVDRENFLKTQILFWLLAAIDGHAKNFSVFLEQNNAFRLTPLYDIMSAYPLMGAKGIPMQKAKMAMALLGKNKQYHWSKIQTRHFFSTANSVGFPENRLLEVIDTMKQSAESVVNDVANMAPKSFPDRIVTPILEGVLNQAKKLHP